MFKFLACNFLFLLGITVSSNGQQHPINNGLESIPFNYQTFTPTNQSNKDAWSKFNTGYENHPDFGKSYYFTPHKRNVEIISKRTEFEKFYVNPERPSEFFQQKGYEAVHFKKDNNWVTIDSRISPVGVGVYEASNQVEPVGFDINNKYSYIKTSASAKVRFNSWKLFGENTTGDLTLIAEPNWNNFSAGDDGIYIKEIFPGIDAEMRTTRGGIKTNFIVNKNLFGSYKNLIFKDVFQCDQHINLEFKHKTNNEIQIGDAYVNLSGKSIVEIGKAVVSSKTISGTSADIAYKMDDATLNLIVPVSYIEKYISAGAIVIDPLVTGSATYASSLIGSRYNASCGFDNTCDYTMSVPTPANCTFTDVNWTYGVIASSPCGRENGGFRFRAGTCGMPTGYYWHCTDVGAGACAGTISEWGYFKPCLPAPSCSSSNVDFTLSMFRGCVGDTGCSSSCFGAYWNWVMTIEGRTIEFLGDSIQYSGNDSICVGNSIKFKTKTQNGVTGYIPTNWSYSATGSPSIGTGDSITINFTKKGTYTIYANAKDACNIAVQKSTTIFVDSVVSPITTTTFNYCLGDTASTLSATKRYSTDALIWYTVATGGTGSSTAPTPNTSTAGTFTYYVSQKSYLGCESNRTAITVNINPRPSSPIVTTPINYCLDGVTSALSATGSTLLWYTAATGGTGSATAPTPSSASAGTTTYYVSQTSALGCEGHRTAINVNVNPIPAVPTVSSPVTYCQEATTSALSATGSTLLWYTAATGGTGSTTAPTPSSASAGTTTYYVSQTSALGCEGHRTAINVNVNPIPAVPKVNTPVNICANTSTSSLVSSGINLKWYTAVSGGTGSTTAPTPSSASVGTTTYYVSQTTTLGCEGHRASIVVNVNPTPSLKITPIGVSDFVFCEGKTITLQGSSTTPVIYQWKKSGLPISGATFDTFSTGVKGYYQVLITDALGCQKQDSVYVSDNTLAKATLSPTNVQICDGVNIILFCSPAKTGYKYEWNKDGLPISGITTADNVPVSTKGVYTVKVTDIYNCISTTNESNVTTYPVIPKPKIIKADPVLSLDKTYAKYQWYRNNKMIFGATSSTYTMTFDGSYFAEVSDLNGCSKYSDTVDRNALAINNVQSGNVSIKFYPNPTQNIINIESPIKINLMIFDVIGKLILEEKNATKVNLENYADGTYLFRISDVDGNLIHTEKIKKISL